MFLELIESHNECVFLSILSHIPQSSHFFFLFISQFIQHQNTCDNSLIMREMNEGEGRKRLILRFEKRNDCFEREIECVIHEM